MISGKYLVAVINNEVIEGVQKWSVSEEVDKLDGQTAVHQGFSANEPGSKTASISIELAQDITTGPWLEIAAGNTITSMRLFRNDGDNTPAFNFPIVNVFSAENAGEIKGKWTVRISAENYGPYSSSNPGSG